MNVEMLLASLSLHGKVVGGAVISAAPLTAARAQKIKTKMRKFGGGFHHGIAHAVGLRHVSRNWRGWAAGTVSCESVPEAGR